MALPGIKEYLPTTNGQYVYYKDNSFTDSVYLGFLQYDENTYAIRYVAESSQKNVPFIEIIVTLNPDKDYVELTGEKIIPAVSNENTNILNYMHDILYEFVSRRQKLNDADFSQSYLKPIANTEYYPQFGGTVTLNYNAVIPLFSLESIIDKEGNSLFKLVKMGTVSNESKTGWDTFLGIPEKALNNENTNYTNLKISDEDFANMNKKWKQKDAFYFMDENAFMYSLNVSTTDRLSLLRNFSLSSKENTVYYHLQHIELLDNNVLRVTNITQQNDSDNLLRDIRIVFPIVDSTSKLTGITLYNKYYKENLFYFNKLVKISSEYKN